MSKALLNDMRQIFGESFGRPAGKSLTESSLAEGPPPFLNKDPQMRAKLDAKLANKKERRRGERELDKVRADFDKEGDETSKRWEKARKHDPFAAIHKKAMAGDDKSGDYFSALRGRGREAGHSQSTSGSGKTNPGGGGSKKHSPFKRASHLGLGPGTPPGFAQVVGKRHHDELKCWNCSCPEGAYRGCKCIGTGKDKTCPEGHEKKVKIKRDYRQAYNDMYHAWRRGEKSKGSSVTGRLQSRGK